MNAWLDGLIRYLLAPLVVGIFLRWFDERSHRRIDRKLNILLNGKALREMKERGEA